MLSTFALGTSCHRLVTSSADINWFPAALDRAEVRFEDLFKTLSKSDSPQLHSSQRATIAQLAGVTFGGWVRCPSLMLYRLYGIPPGGNPKYPNLSISRSPKHARKNPHPFDKERDLKVGDPP
jgi:hypothetical protein